MANVAVVGAGMMGTAFCRPLCDAGHGVRLIGTPLDDTVVRQLRERRRHPRLDAGLPPGVEVFHRGQLDQALLGVDAIVVGVSSAGVHWAASALRATLSSTPLPLLLLSKGLEAASGTPRVLSQVLSAALAEHGVRVRQEPVAVCGPCIAGELARAVPTVVVFAGRDATAREGFASLARTQYYRVVTSPDALGVQACAALKNAYALGVALAAGLHERGGGTAGSVALHNYEAAVFAQAMLEMQVIVETLGGEARSVVGLAGAGDLTVTCNGGRTGRFGRLLGMGHSRARAVELMQGDTLECLEVLDTLRSCRGAPGGLPVERLPLLRHLFEVTLDGDPVAMPFAEFFST